jgi:hypothetical protein
MMSTPVAFFVFNRPELTSRVFERIRQARPPKLFVVCDGPRNDRSDDLAKVAAVRKIVEQVDWPCEVRWDYAEVNLGCRHRVASGLNWVFEQVEEAIILEDDTLPDASFFPFCQELLERYRDDDRIMHIGGANFVNSQNKPNQSYIVSHYVHIWGWATWRRAWLKYDFSASSWRHPSARAQMLKALDLNAERAYWAAKFDQLFGSGQQVDTWDYQWLITCWANQGLALQPTANLVDNLGFGADATHTKGTALPPMAPASRMSFPLSHPNYPRRSKLFDCKVFWAAFMQLPEPKALWLRSLLSRMLQSYASFRAPSQRTKLKA